MIIQPSAPRSAHIPPNIYRVTCIGARPHILENPQYGRGDVVMLQLRTELVDRETGEPIVLEKMCNKVWNSRSTLWACAEALGYHCRQDVPLDTDDLIGHQAQAVVKDDVGNDGTVYSKVDTLVPLPQEANGAYAAPAPTYAAPPPVPQRGPVMQNWGDAPPPPNNLAQELHARAEQLAAEGHARDDAAYPPLNVLTQNGSIDWPVFWEEAKKRGLTRYLLTQRLSVSEVELDDQLRQMMPLAVIDLLKSA